MSEALKPCPFCGGKAATYDELVAQGGYVGSGSKSVQCMGCSAGSAMDFETQEEANQAWNQRSDALLKKREALAEYAHEAWAGWMKYMDKKVLWELKESPNPKFPETWLERWARLMHTPYKDLTENEKASDREEADRMLKIIEDN